MLFSFCRESTLRGHVLFTLVFIEPDLAPDTFKGIQELLNHY